MEDAKVVVIGAGVAGISAASHLIENGIKNVTILEARSRIGGRLHVQDCESGRRLLMGAQWVHGVCEDNLMFKLAEKHNLLTMEMERCAMGDLYYESFDLEHVHVRGGRILSKAIVETAGKIHQKIGLKAQSYFKSVDGKVSDKEATSMEDFFNREADAELSKLNLSPDEAKDVEAALFGCFKNILTGYTGGEMSKCRFEMFGAAEELPGGDLELPVEIIDALAKEVPEDTMKLNTKVTKINWTDKNSIKIICHDSKREYEANFVICTLPIGVLQRFHEQMFQPPLPEWKVKAIDQTGPGANGKYFVEWDKPWRRANDHPILIAWTREEMESIRLPQDWTRGVLEISAEDPASSLMLVWVTGDCAQAADTLDDETVKKDIGELLRTFVGDPTIPDPDHLTRNRWTQEEFSLGSYSCAKLIADESTFETNGKPLPNSENPRLLFAGEATHPSLWSFLHGARASGIREADRILTNLKK